LKELTLSDLEVAIDECCRIYGEREMIVVGSMAILGTTAIPSVGLRMSDDIDLYPAHVPSDKTLLVALELGIDSEFREERGWFVESVGDWTTKTSPEGWKSRLLPVETPAGNIGHCLAPSDLAFNKIEAGRPKDIPYVAEMIRSGFVTAAKLESLIANDPREEEIREKLRATLKATVDWAKSNLATETILPEIVPVTDDSLADREMPAEGEGAPEL
jgi:SepF-like predicted cell division protein (DUF552 family)